MEKSEIKQRSTKNIVNQGSSRVLRYFSYTECNDISFPTFLPGIPGQQDDIDSYKSFCFISVLDI